MAITLLEIGYNIILSIFFYRIERKNAKLQNRRPTAVLFDINACDEKEISLTVLARGA